MLWVSVCTFVMVVIVGTGFYLNPVSTAFNRNTFSGIETIEVQSGNTGEVVTITNTDDVSILIGYFIGNTFSKSQLANQTGWRYRLKCFDMDRKIKVDILVISPNQVIIDSYLYTSASVDNQIDLSFIQGLVE